MADPAHPGIARRRALVIDDDPAILRAIRIALESSGIEVLTAPGLGQARVALLGNPDIGVILCDHLLPDGTGADFLREAKVEYPAAVRLIMTGAHVFDKSVALQAINSGEIYRFLAKPFGNDELVGAILQSFDRFALVQENQALQQRLAEQNLQLQRHNDHLAERVRLEEQLSRGLREETVNWRRAFRQAVELCLHVMERLDRPLHAHSQRVAATCAAIARDLHLDAESVEHAELAGWLHDFGLIGAPAAVRTLQRTPTQVTPAERDILLLHPHLASELIDFIPHPSVAEAVEAHHELLDGSGYPHGLAGERIPRLARIVAVADAFEESGTEREFALSALELGAGRLFDSEVVRSLVRVLQGDRIPQKAERALLLGELRAGMRTTMPILTGSGMLLVRQGQVLTDTLIRRLRQHSELNNIQQNIFVEA